jgi:hypothetical protein
MDPVTMGIAGGMMLGGTALNMYGSSKRDKASRRAMKNYQAAVNAKASADRAAMQEEQGLLSGLASERQRGIGSYLTDLSYAQRPGTDEGFSQRNAGALTDIGKMTQGDSGSGYAYSGAPQAQAQNMQDVRTGGENKTMAEALMADYTLGQIQEREQSAGHRMAFGDILRNYKGGNMQQRFQLARALRDLDWQRKTAAMQSKLDAAQRVGQTENMLGGLATQGGGMLMSYGMMGGGGAAGAGASTAASSATPVGVPAGVGVNNLTAAGYTPQPGSFAGAYGAGGPGLGIPTNW